MKYWRLRSERSAAIRCHSLNVCGVTYRWAENERAKSNQGRLSIGVCQWLRYEGAAAIRCNSLNTYKSAYHWAENEKRKANYFCLPIVKCQRLSSKCRRWFAVSHWTPIETRIDDPKTKDQKRIVPLCLSDRSSDCTPDSRRTFTISHWIFIELRINDPKMKNEKRIRIVYISESNSNYASKDR